MKRGDTLEARRAYITRLRTFHGLTIEAIAVKLMCSYTLVQRKLKEWKVEPAIEAAPEEPEPEPTPEPEPEPAPPIAEDILPAKTARQLLDERNAAILELVDAGMRDEDIARKLGLKSRGVVIGVRHRNGRVKTDDEVRHASRQNARRLGTMQSAKRAHLKTQIEQQVETPIAALDELETLVDARPESVAIPFEQVTGCRWPFGDILDNPPLTYCNAACCSVTVRGGDGTSHRTRYCADHWNARRASNHTKVVA